MASRELALNPPAAPHQHTKPFLILTLHYFQFTHLFPFWLLQHINISPSSKACPNLNSIATFLPIHPSTCSHFLHIAHSSPGTAESQKLLHFLQMHLPQLTCLLFLTHHSNSCSGPNAVSPANSGPNSFFYILTTSTIHCFTSDHTNAPPNSARQ